MGPTRKLIDTLMKLPAWALRQPRERWLVHQAVGRIRATAGEPVTPRLVVFVTESVGSRIAKLGYGLKSIGWRVVLLHRREPPRHPGKCFDELHRYATRSEEHTSELQSQR